MIVHDGDAAFDAQLGTLAASHQGAAITVRREPQGQTLGELRNASVEAARGDIVCQWDDDDRYHPRRLELQFAAMRVENSEFCFLTDQLHLFAPDRTMYWDDWKLEVHPLKPGQGTLVGSKAARSGAIARARGHAADPGSACTPRAPDHAPARAQFACTSMFSTERTPGVRPPRDHQRVEAFSWRARWRSSNPCCQGRLARIQAPLGQFVMPLRGAS